MRAALVRHRDLLLAGAFLVFALAEVVAGGRYEGEPNWPGPWPLASLAAVLMTAPLALRRTRPMLSACVVLGTIAIYALLTTGGEATAGFLATWVAVFSGAAYARKPWLVGLLAVLASATLAVHNVKDPAVRDAGDWFWSAGLFAVALLFGLAVRNRQIRIVSLEHEAVRAAREQQALVAAATAAERAAIARELHDIVAHAVSVIVVQAQAGSRSLADDPRTTGRALEVIEDTGRSALDDLRRLLQVLRDEGETGPDPSPGLAHLHDLVDRFRTAGLDVTLEADQTPALSGAADLAAYRLVQEALTNTVRHAPGSPARVRVTREADGITVTAEDDGRTSPVDTSRGGAGRGLIGMRERVTLAGGRLVECGPTGTGFRVVAELPT